MISPPIKWDAYDWIVIKITNNSILRKTLGPFDDIGFVPTMGGIHEGHVSLIKKSIRFNKKTIVSIFVNPKQFNETKDFKSYPSNIKNEKLILKKIKKLDKNDIPQFKDIYENKKILKPAKYSKGLSNYSDSIEGVKFDNISYEQFMIITKYSDDT